MTGTGNGFAEFSKVNVKWEAGEGREDSRIPKQKNVNSSFTK